MKKQICIYSILLILFACTGRKADRGQETNVVNNHLLTLLKQGDYFRLESSLQTYKSQISKGQFLYFRSYLSNAFNRNEEAIRIIDSLLVSFNPADSIRAELFILQSDCFFKTFQYSKDARICNILIQHFAPYIDSSKLSEMKNHLLLCEALKNVPPQETRLTKNTNIQWTKDKLGLTEIPVKRLGNLYSGIFDTRANISCITKTYAEKLKLEILGTSYEESSGMTGIKFKADIGIADSLYIGDILIRNVVFEVLPDSILYIAPLQISLDIIIGYPVISQWGEIHIHQDGRMEIPVHQNLSTLHNLALEKLDPVLFLKTTNDTLCFHFDFGAMSTQLYASYYTRYKSKIEQEGRRTRIQSGGAGGIVQKEIYRIPSFELYLGDNKTVLDSVDVLKEKIFPDEKYYGNLGQDFISKFSEIILNFTSMYIDGKN
jgi:hypothetical protein